MDAERLGLAVPAPRVGLEAVRGIEIEPYAAELARVTLWIGDLQWLQKNGYTAWAEPILSSLDRIENRDALLTADGTEATWPAADAIVGNPPFLGGKKLRDNLGDAYVGRLFAAFRGRVPAEADFVCYWVEKAWRQIAQKNAERAGLVTTNSIRGGPNRRVLAPIADAGALHEAWADQPWVLEGAAVRVSMLGFGAGFIERRLEGFSASQINADLTGANVDLTKAARLKENAGVALQGFKFGGPFAVDGATARSMLLEPRNPNGRFNSEVVRPWMNGEDITSRPRDRWSIDMSMIALESDAALFERPFLEVRQAFDAENERRRKKNQRVLRQGESRVPWWQHQRSRGELRKAMAGIARYIATPEVAKHRLLKFYPSDVVPSGSVYAITRDDDTTFGVLHPAFTNCGRCAWGRGSASATIPATPPPPPSRPFPFPRV